MKNQALFSSKDKSKKLKCRLLQLLFSALRVKGKKLLLWEYFLRNGPCEKRGKNKIEKLHAQKAYSVIGVGRFRILGRPKGGQIPSRHMMS